MRLKKSWSK